MNAKEDPILHFLLVFDHQQGKLIELLEFEGDSQGAIKEYFRREKELAARDRVEIVLIGSDSLETIKLTHANYFDGSAAIGSRSKYLPELRLAV